MSDSDSDNISPSEVPLSSQAEGSATPILGMGETKQAFQKQKQNNKVLWGIFGLLLALVLSVIFVLPKFVSPSDLQPTVVVINPSGSAQSIEITPFQEAQILKQRSDAQDVLAALLAAQEILEEKQVTLWAEAEYLRALEHAKEGDEAYSQQSFIEAEQDYQSGLEILQTLEAGLPTFFASYFESAQAAIIDGDAITAQQAFTVAIAIDANSEAAKLGYNRALVLEDVLTLLNNGSDLHSLNRYEEAREMYQQALAIDDKHLASRSALEQVNRDIVDRNFASYMSQGYSALQEDSPERAETSFRQALSLKPNSPEALAALEQANNQITFNIISLHLDAAQTHVNAEQWQAAITEYDQALSVDPNLVSALEGKSYSSSRNNLDIFLQNTIEAPLRLAEPSVFDQALQVFNDASQINNPGPKLSAQLVSINSILNSIKQPVNVSFQSDGLTNVTLSRVSSLGLFTAQSLALTPGNYTVVGVREGYRDVRQEFVVPLDGSAPQIIIQCDETI